MNGCGVQNAIAFTTAPLSNEMIYIGTRARGSVVALTFERFCHVSSIPTLRLLANLMLPDGAEKHLEDWTIFSLNQTPFSMIAPVLVLESPDSTGKENRSDLLNLGPRKLICGSGRHDLRSNAPFIRS